MVSQGKMSSPRLSVSDERWSLKSPFRISRGTKSEAHVVVVSITRDGKTGRGECVPYARYNENIPGVISTIEMLRPAIEAGASRHDLMKGVKPGAARNAIDCALWDLEAKQSGTRVWNLAGLPEPTPVTTALTISMDTPTAMATAACAAKAPLLKLKLGGPTDIECVAAVRATCPHATLIVDPNESWTFQQLVAFSPALKHLGVSLIEQPIAADIDVALSGFSAPVPLCADESFHTEADLPRILGRYAAVNIKLDKVGGLTAALKLAQSAQNSGLAIMVGSMVASSLSVAPAFMLASLSHFIDLDSPMLLAKDRIPAMPYNGTTLSCPPSELWG